MTDRTIALDVPSQVSIASPCTVSWDGMQGDNRVRFCGECHHNVYNLSDRTAATSTQPSQSADKLNDGQLRRIN